MIHHEDLRRTLNNRNPEPRDWLTLVAITVAVLLIVALIALELTT